MWFSNLSTISSSGDGVVVYNSDSDGVLFLFVRVIINYFVQQIWVVPSFLSDSDTIQVTKYSITCVAKLRSLQLFATF